MFPNRDDMELLNWLNERTSTESNNNGTAFQAAWAGLHLFAAIQHARAFQQDNKVLAPVHISAVALHVMSAIYHARRVFVAKRDIESTQRVPS